MFKINTVFVVIIFLFSACVSTKDTHCKQISLAGKWGFRLDKQDKGKQECWYSANLQDTVLLPGTTDENHKGNKNDKKEISHLSRKYTYEGKAWYQKNVDIPESWNSKNISLLLERSKVTELWVDDTYISSRNSLSTPHVYDLSKMLTPGKHRLTILVDNTANLYDIGSSHALSEHTQTNWNGIIGRIELTAKDKLNIEHIKIIPDVSTKTIKVIAKINNETGKELNIELKLQAKSSSKDANKLLTQTYSLKVKEGISDCDLTYEMGDNVTLWSEFHPNLYKLDISLKDKNKEYADNVEETFGMIDFKTKGTQFAVNGKNIFLRGKHDACVFPLTGHPPMTKEGWVRIFRIAKSYGINHYRFHSYTPPEAAFEAADIVGIYLQPELPLAKSLDKHNVK